MTIPPESITVVCKADSPQTTSPMSRLVYKCVDGHLTPISRNVIIKLSNTGLLDIREINLNFNDVRVIKTTFYYDYLVTEREIKITR
jgi:hypothetical protein